MPTKVTIREPFSYNREKQRKLCASSLSGIRHYFSFLFFMHHYRVRWTTHYLIFTVGWLADISPFFHLLLNLWKIPRNFCNYNSASCIFNGLSVFVRRTRKKVLLFCINAQMNNDNYWNVINVPDRKINKKKINILARRIEKAIKVNSFSHFYGLKIKYELC